MSSKVFALDTRPGVQRDGTTFDRDFYTSGQWVRFQRGRPRKMLGYSRISDQVYGPSRGIWVNSSDGLNQVFSGRNDGLQQLLINNAGLGAGVTDISLYNFTASDNNLWQFDGFYDIFGSGVGSILAHPGQNLAQIDSTANTPVLIGNINEVPLSTVAVTGVGGQISCTATVGLEIGQIVKVTGVLTGTATGITSNTSYYVSATNGTTTFTLVTLTGGALTTTAGTTTGLTFTLVNTVMSQIGVFYDSNSYLTNGSPIVTVGQSNPLIGAGQTVTGTGIPSGTTVVSAVGSSEILSTVAVTGTSGTFSCSATPGLFPGQSVTVSGDLGNTALTGITVGASGTFTCTATTGLYVNQPVAVTGTPSTQALASVAITSSSGAFSCTSTTGLAVGQPVSVTGTLGTTTLSGVTWASETGSFTCTSSTLYVGMPITVSGSPSLLDIGSVTVTTTVGNCICTNTGGLRVGQSVYVTGTLTGTATGISTNRTYYIIDTNQVSYFQLSATPGGTALTTGAGTTTGLVFKVLPSTGITTNTTYYVITTNGTTTFTLSSTLGGESISTQYVASYTNYPGLTFAGPVGTGISSSTTYYITATNNTSTFSLSATPGGAVISNTYGATTGLTFNLTPYSGITPNTLYYITVTNGSSTFTLSTSIGGTAITTVSGVQVTGLVFTVPKYIGLTSGSTYYIIATNNSTTFTLSATVGGSAITTFVATTTGYVFTTGLYTKVTLSKNATASGLSLLTFNNNVEVSGGVVSLHPYVFVYGNNGLIKNCAAGNSNDWVSADANETNVATGKIVQGLPVRGGSNAPSGLFWSLESLIRVSYIGGAGTPPQFWRYDIISSQSSILSSQSAIEYDGVYYWCGVDRFLLYNGVVKEIPNEFNQNYFFDNLNYSQRQKVWVTKVPRYGEIWWFYPRGDATECTDAIIYNVRENVWYDAGEALGARRSAGYFSTVFSRPIEAGWEPNAAGVVDSITITSPGSGYTNGVYDLLLTGGSGTGAAAVVTIAGTVVTNIVIFRGGEGYEVGDVLSVPLPSTTSSVLTVTKVVNTIKVWQHEIGTDVVDGTDVLAIESYFETNDLGLVSGGPSEPSRVGENRWLRIDRIEPDFIQSGDMTVTVTGRPFAQSDDVESAEFVFGPNTGKVDMREQRRELRLKFKSNVAGGNYQLGKLLLTAEFGDTRPY